MTYEHINNKLKPILIDFLDKLKIIENELNEQMEFYKKEHQSWLTNNDFRPGSFSRILSPIIASKFITIQTLEYLNKENWQDDYRQNHMPEPWKDGDYFGHFKEIALLIRFHLIHSIYSQIETTNRIIINKKGLRTNKKPALSVNELTNTYNQYFIKFIDFIRNTIHNNGYHYPTNTNNNYWTYNFKGKIFTFNIGEPINIEFPDIIEIINELISCLLNTLRHSEIINIDLTADIT